MEKRDEYECIEFRSCFELARKGDADAMCDLAFCYEDGVGVDTDSCQAFSWFEEAGNAGSITAQLRIAHDYLSWDGGLVKALSWARRAGQQGSPEGLRLATLIKEIISDFDRERREEIFEICRHEAELGCPGAQTLLGEFYEEEAISSSLCRNKALYQMKMAKDYERAVRWFDRAAAQGSADAYYGLYKIFFFYNIGSLHYAAKKPEEYIMEQADCLLSKAVELGSSRAKVVAGRRLISWSDPKTYRPSRELISEAARQGCEMGCGELFKYYWLGIGGVESNHVTAIALAFFSGDTEDDVEARIGVGQDKHKITEGHALAQAWKRDISATLPV